MAGENTYTDGSKVLDYGAQAADASVLVDDNALQSLQRTVVGEQSQSRGIALDLFGRLVAVWRQLAPLQLKEVSIPEQIGKMLLDLLVAEAEAASLKVPEALLSGRIAHMLISMDLVNQPLLNGVLLPDLSLSALFGPGTGRRRPDLARLTTLEFWEIKNKATITADPEKVEEQLDAYGVRLKRGEQLGSLRQKGKAEARVPGVAWLVFEYEHFRDGLIKYSGKIDVDKILERLARRIVQETLDAIEREFKELKDRVRSTHVQAALIALAVVVIIASLSVAAGTLVTACELLVDTLLAAPELILLVP
jgi:hypothetical protein